MCTYVCVCVWVHVCECEGESNCVMYSRGKVVMNFVDQIKAIHVNSQNLQLLMDIHAYGKKILTV